MKAGTVIRITGLALIIGVTMLGYTFLLTTEAKEQLKTSTKSIRLRVGEIQKKFEEMQGIDMEEDLAEDNRQATEQQWKRLGY